MKRINFRYLAALPIVAAVLTSTSCIFEAPGDKFYRTLWTSDEVQLSPDAVKELTLEFLCQNYVSLKTDSSTIISYGTYSSNKRTAVFSDLTMDLDGLMITFLDAELTGDTLFLRWEAENSDAPVTTAMHRKVTYQNNQ